MGGMVHMATRPTIVATSATQQKNGKNNQNLAEVQLPQINKITRRESLLRVELYRILL